MKNLKNRIKLYTAFAIVQILCSVALYAFAVLLLCASAGAFLVIYQIVRNSFPNILLWKYILLLAIPVWLFFEVNILLNVNKKDKKKVK